MRQAGNILNVFIGKEKAKLTIEPQEVDVSRAAGRDQRGVG